MGIYATFLTVFFLLDLGMLARGRGCDDLLAHELCSVPLKESLFSIRACRQLYSSYLEAVLVFHFDVLFIQSVSQFVCVLLGWTLTHCSVHLNFHQHTMRVRKILGLFQ